MVRSLVQVVVRVFLALAVGLLVTPGVGQAQDGPRVVVRVQGLWLTFQDNTVDTGHGPLSTQVRFDNAPGVEVGAELALHHRLGLELSTAYARFDTHITDTFNRGPGFPPTVLRSSETFRFTPLTVGLNVHALRGERVDLYFGPTYSQARYGGGELLKDGSAWGAVVGLDVQSASWPWAFTARVSYLRAPIEGQLTDPSVRSDLNTFLFAAGIAHRF